MVSPVVDEALDAAGQRIGTVLREKYRLDRVLGVGGMAAVYVATHRNRKQFAVKVLHPELSRSKDVRARFVREGYAANSVDHPGAVAVLDDDIAEDGSAFLVMELLEGAPVEALWEQRGSRMDAADVLAMTSQLLDVLACASSKSIVHRDVKPANIFVTREGVVKLLDFGIARVRDVASSNMTQSGTLLGTPAFMPPEQALGNIDQLDGRSDVWAVGATMFALLSGRYVHDGDTVQKLMIQAATMPARPLLATAADIPPAVAAVVDRALAFEPAARWPSAAEMKLAVDRVHEGLFGRAPSAGALAAALFQPGKSNEPLSFDDTVEGRPPEVPPYVPRTMGGLAATSGERTPRAGVPRAVVALVVSGIAGVLLIAAAAILIVRHRAAARRDDAHVAAATNASAPPDLVEPTATATASALGATTLLPLAPSASSAPSGLGSGVAPVPRLGVKGKGGKAAPPKAAKPNDCEPNYTVDALGEKHFKPECF